jgi:hypothetical protein
MFVFYEFFYNGIQRTACMGGCADSRLNFQKLLIIKLKNYEFRYKNKQAISYTRCVCLACTSNSSKVGILSRGCKSLIGKLLKLY